MINQHTNRSRTQEEINKHAHWFVNEFTEQVGSFTLPTDPLFKYNEEHHHLLPYEKCQCCGHDKFFLVYHYKCWEIGPKRMSHFGILRCDKCGEAITWVNKHLRDMIIKVNKIDVSEVD